MVKDLKKELEKQKRIILMLKSERNFWDKEFHKLKKNCIKAKKLI